MANCRHYHHAMLGFEEGKSKASGSPKMKSDWLSGDNEGGCQRQSGWMVGAGFSRRLGVAQP